MAIERRFSDQEIIESLRTEPNVSAVVTYLYRENYKKVQTYILQNSGVEEDAQDIFQEMIVTFIELAKQGKFRGESSISTFLLALTRNIWLNELKKRGRSLLREEKFQKASDTVDADASKYIINREMRTQLFKLLDQLGETCKKILLAYYYNGLSMREILQQLEYENEQVVRNKKYKCLKQLEQILASKPVIANNLKSILSYE